MTQEKFYSITYASIKKLCDTGKLKLIGSNRIHNQGTYSINGTHTKLYRKRSSASKVVFDLIAKS